MAIKSVPLGGAFEHNYDPRGRQFGRTKLKKFNFPTSKIRVIIFTTNWHWGGIDIFPHQVDNSVTGLWVVMVMVIWLFYLPERYSVFFLQSSMSISAVPEITSSSSRASKRLTKLASNTFGKKWRHVMIHPEKRVIKHAIIIVYMI